MKRLLKKRKLIAVILTLVLCLSNMTIYVYGDEDTVIVELFRGNNSTFETGAGNWKKLYGGKVRTENSPNGTGNVLANSGRTRKWDTMGIDIKPMIQQYVEGPCTLTVSLDVYSTAASTSGLVIRVDNAADMSMTAETNVNEVFLKIFAAKANQWVTVTGEITITEQDLVSDADHWYLCLDSIPVTVDTFYIDNAHLTFEAEKEPIIVEPDRTSEMQFGVIRWDAYTDSTLEADGSTSEGVPTVASQVAKNLSPFQYRWQAPFFSNIENEKVVFPEYTVATWDKEAEYASQAGIDYFAYLWYNTTSAMSTARKAHLSSSKKNLIKMCGIIASKSTWATRKELYMAMQDECYLTYNGMPVLFVYYLSNWGEEDIAQIREEAALVGVTQPIYIIGMLSYSSVQYVSTLYTRGMDAFSWYGIGADGTAISYQKLTELNMEMIKDTASEVAACGTHMVPTITSGMYTKARIDGGVTWQEGDPDADNDEDKPYKNYYAQSGTAVEIANWADEVLTWVENNPEVTEPNLVLTYAWNEHDEGGWLCPTIKVDTNGNPIYDADGKIQVDNSRLEELKKVIDEHRENYE